MGPGPGRRGPGAGRPVGDARRRRARRAHARGLHPHPAGAAAVRAGPARPAARGHHGLGVPLRAPAARPAGGGGADGRPRPGRRPHDRGGRPRRPARGPGGRPHRDGPGLQGAVRLRPRRARPRRPRPGLPRARCGAGRRQLPRARGARLVAGRGRPARRVRRGWRLQVPPAGRGGLLPALAGGDAPAPRGHRLVRRVRGGARPARGRGGLRRRARAVRRVHVRPDVAPPRGRRPRLLREPGHDAGLAAGGEPAPGRRAVRRVRRPRRRPGRGPSGPGGPGRGPGRLPRPAHPARRGRSRRPCAGGGCSPTTAATCCGSARRPTCATSSWCAPSTLLGEALREG